MKNTHRAGRSGFTLIEILVVIAIIAILAALLTGGIWAFLGKGPEIRARNDMLQLSAALQNFKAKYGFYPPDEIKLHTNYNQYNTANALDAQSLQAINKMYRDLGNFTNVHWAGPGITLPAAGVTLEGDQALVFFLGGPPANAAAGVAAGSMSPIPMMGGFLSNPVDPIGTAASTQDRIKFMTFEGGRLQLVHRANNNAVWTLPSGHLVGFPSFIDAYNKTPNPMPYVYFWSGLRPNHYTGVANSLGVSSYLQQAAAGTAPAQYWNPNTYQIICAGADGQFGAGNALWPPSAHGHGLDDMSNFTDVKLGNAP